MENVHLPGLMMTMRGNIERVEAAKAFRVRLPRMDLD